MSHSLWQSVVALNRADPEAWLALTGRARLRAAVLIVVYVVAAAFNMRFRAPPLPHAAQPVVRADRYLALQQLPVTRPPGPDHAGPGSGACRATCAASSLGAHGWVSSIAFDRIAEMRHMSDATSPASCDTGGHAQHQYPATLAQ